MARPGHRRPQCSPGSIPIKDIELNAKSRGDLPHAPLNQLTRHCEIIGTRNVGRRFRLRCPGGHRACGSFYRIDRRFAVLDIAACGSAENPGTAAMPRLKTDAERKVASKPRSNAARIRMGARVSGVLCRLHPLGGVLRRLLLRIRARIIKAIDCFSDGLLVLGGFLLGNVRDRSAFSQQGRFV